MEQERKSDLTEFRVYEHPLLPKRLVKRGFSWPALIVGPAYLIYRRLWIPLAVWGVTIFLISYLARLHYQLCNEEGFCYLLEEDKNAVETISNAALFLGMLVIGKIANSFWEKDLIKRGYIATKILFAQSLDDARAIIEREKYSVVTPSHTSANEDNGSSSEHN